MAVKLPIFFASYLSAPSSLLQSFARLFLPFLYSSAIIILYFSIFELSWKADYSDYMIIIRGRVWLCVYFYMWFSVVILAKLTCVSSNEAAKRHAAAGSPIIRRVGLCRCFHSRTIRLFKPALFSNYRRLNDGCKTHPTCIFAQGDSDWMWQLKAFHWSEQVVEHLSNNRCFSPSLARLRYYYSVLHQVFTYTHVVRSGATGPQCTTTDVRYNYDSFWWQGG